MKKVLFFIVGLSLLIIVYFSYIYQSNDKHIIKNDKEEVLPAYSYKEYTDNLFGKVITNNPDLYKEVYLYGKVIDGDIVYSGDIIASISGSTISFQSISLNFPKEFIGRSYRSITEGGALRSAILHLSDKVTPFADDIIYGKKIVINTSKNIRNLTIQDMCQIHEPGVGDSIPLESSQEIIKIGGKDIYRTYLLINDGFIEDVSSLCTVSGDISLSIFFYGYGKEEQRKILDSFKFL